MEKDFSHPNINFWQEGEFVYYKVGKEKKTYQLTLDQARQYWLTDKDYSPKEGCNDKAGWVKYLDSMQQRAWTVCQNRPGKLI